MAVSRRAVGLGLLGLGVAATAGYGILGDQGIGGLLTGSIANPDRTWGFIGGEKSAYMANATVVERLRRKHGLIVDSRRAGSVEMVSDPALTRQSPDFVWPSSSVLAELARSNGLPVRRDKVIFNSPIVLYSWRPIVDALIGQGIAKAEPAGFTGVDLARLTELIATKTAWRDIGVNELFGTMSWASTHPAKSNSGFMFAGLLANLLTNGIATPQTLADKEDVIVFLFDRMGYKEHSSGKLFDGYLSEGMSGKPIIVGYENQLVEFARENPEMVGRLRGIAEPVTLYPSPTVFSAHSLISLTPIADRLIEALLDPELQHIAWVEHGFRGPVGSLTGEEKPFPYMPNSVPDILPMPGAATMLRLVAAVGDAT